MMTRAELAAVLDRLCPMYVLLDSTGHVLQAGPTLQKLRTEQQLEGRRFLEIFEVLRPRSVTAICDLFSVADRKLHLRFRDEPRTGLKGQVVVLPDQGGVIVNMSFGISILEAVQDYALTSADFSATELAIELLYLVEAKSAAMEASRTLNLRLQGAMIAAEEQAFTDTLTGLKNRRAMDHVLSRMKRRGDAFALMHLDLDFFKDVNDTLGHAAGDHVLQHVARLMVEQTRSEDTVARIGGDEFVIIFSDLTDKSQLDPIATRLIAKLEEPIVFGSDLCRISASAGTVLSHQMAPTEPAALLHAADLALYAAKHQGRACHRFFVPEMAGDHADRSSGPDQRAYSDAAASREHQLSPGAQSPGA